ncbi:MAG: glycoside hydrolase family 97 C-terminal domain-containing protein, partial [Cytophagaceae bacterium]
EVGDFVTIAREERGTGNWFVGGITDESKREITVNFDFLPEGKKFNAVIYQDGKDAQYKTNPTSIEIVKTDLDKSSTKTFKLAEGGGFAISLLQVK